MDKMYLHEIADAIGGKVIFGNPEVFVTSVVTDSRTATENSLFIRFGEDKPQTSDYLLDAYKNGASIAIVGKIDEELIPSDRKGMILTENVEKALMELASYYRNRIKSKIIAVSGSTGKTSVKDMLCGMLSKKFRVYRTDGNKNNNIGLPLTILNADLSADICVLEMGMDTFGEIDGLSRIARQDISMLTNIGMSHIERLGSQENIFKAKMEIVNYFNESNYLILNADDKYLSQVKSDTYKVIGAGIEHGDYRAINIEIDSKYSSFDVLYNEKNLGRITLGMSGLHNVRNAILCFACAHKFGIKTEDLKSFTFEPTGMRKEKLTFLNVEVISDAYNASPDSMMSGLDVLAMSEGRKVALLGDMLELGSFSKEAHKNVGEYARDKADFVIAVGEFSEEVGKGYGKKNFVSFKTVEEAMNEIPNLITKDDTVLLKASRGLRFERFLPILENI